MALSVARKGKLTMNFINKIGLIVFILASQGFISAIESDSKIGTFMLIPILLVSLWMFLIEDNKDKQ